MKSFGTYISTQLLRFLALILALLAVNAVIFGIVFSRTIAADYGDTAPQAMLDQVSSAVTTRVLADSAAEVLRQNDIWAIYLNAEGSAFWSFDLPEEIPQRYTIQDIAQFSKGYIKDYPVFVRNTVDGLLILGYPKDSYTKLTSNYYSIKAIQRLPFLIVGLLMLDMACLFLVYFFSKQKIIKGTQPIVSAVDALADGTTVCIRTVPELAGIADRVNQASILLSRQNEARANWISGVSHDIRTPLSTILGYADQIAEDVTASSEIRNKAGIMRRQSIKIRELVQDLNLVSQLEYDMQPLRMEPVRPAKLLRTIGADLLNSGLPSVYAVEMEITPEAEAITMQWDTRLMIRAINNLVQNSIRHNPQGCKIVLCLKGQGDDLILSVSDDGIGLTSEKQRELKENPHYMKSTDESLNLRHGLGLFLVQEIVTAHRGTVAIENTRPHGCRTVLQFHIDAQAS